MKELKGGEALFCASAFLGFLNNIRNSTYKNIIIVDNRLKLGFVNRLGFMKKFQPILSLTGFLQCNLQLADEIRTTLCVHAFRNIRSDTCTRFIDLMRHHKLVLLLFQIAIEFDDSQSKSLAQIIE